MSGDATPAVEGGFRPLAVRRLHYLMYFPGHSGRGALCAVMLPRVHNFVKERNHEGALRLPNKGWPLLHR